MIHCPKCNTPNNPGSSFCMQCGAPLVEQTDGDTLGGLETTMPEKAEDAAAPAPASTELEPGSIFAGRYRIERKIGHGGMGVVYLAIETLAGRDRNVALKLIRSDRLADRKSIDRLISEGALTQNIRHQNVVAVYNVGEADGQPFVAMEFVEGVSLREWHRRQLGVKEEISLATIASVVRGILDGLEAAHRLEIVHRDLKPENVILTGTPTDEAAPLKILDFGIASAPGALESGTGTGLGTPRYMAPEQITNPSTAGPPADLYSLSIIFYELLMDVLPQGHWQPPSGGRGDVPHAIDALIEKGLSNRPASRQQDVPEYRTELATALAAEDEPNKLQRINFGALENLDAGVDAYKSRWRAMLSTTQGKIGIAAAALLGLFVALGGGDEEFGSGSEDFYEEGTGAGGSTATESVPGDTGRGLDGGSDADVPEALSTPRNRIALLDGTWDDGDGVRYQVRTSPDGTYSASGRLSDGTPVNLHGNITAGQYRGSAGGVSFVGQSGWDGSCHINFRSFTTDGTLIGAGQFHVDHTPGAPCPARFNN